jgi:hypothetical protein
MVDDAAEAFGYCRLLRTSRDKRTGDEPCQVERVEIAEVILKVGG